MTALAEWVNEAACKEGEDPRRWDTTRVNQATLVDADVERARATCLACPVMMDCLLHGVVFEKRDQIWGGLTDEERDVWALREGLVEAAA